MGHWMLATMLDLLKQPAILAALAAALVVGAVLVARQVSRRLAWDAAGPIALIAAAPLLPHVTVLASLSFDDLLPLVGLGMLVWRLPVPRLSRDPLVRGLVVAVVVAIGARVASAIANGGGLEGTILMLGQAVARPPGQFLSEPGGQDDVGHFARQHVAQHRLERAGQGHAGVF